MSSSLIAGQQFDEPTLVVERRKAIDVAIKEAAALAKQGFAARRSADIPLVSRKKQAKHSTYVAAFDFCRRPSAFDRPTAEGMPVVRDTEAARDASTQVRQCSIVVLATTRGLVGKHAVP